MDEAQSLADLAAKDRRIDDLVFKAEQLVADLTSTVTDMKRILSLASQQVQEGAGDERQRERGQPGEPAGGPA